MLTPFSLLFLLAPGPSNAPGKLHVLDHDRDALRVYGTQVRVLEQAHEVRFSGFLYCEQG